MSLPEHVAEEWARQALSRASLRELREAIADAIEYLKIYSDSYDPSSDEAFGLLDRAARILSDTPVNELRDEAPTLFELTDKAYDYIALLAEDSVDSALDFAIDLIDDFFDVPLPENEIRDALAPEVREYVNEIATRASRLVEAAERLRSLFERYYYDETVEITESDVDEIISTIDEMGDELWMISYYDIDLVALIAARLIRILEQLDEALVRVAGEEE